VYEACDPGRVNARCTRCGKSLLNVSVAIAMYWLSSAPANTHRCWVPDTPPRKYEDPVDCAFCGKVFEHGDFEALGRHVWTECGARQAVLDLQSTD
jgi:phage FluMu protein Com